MKLIPAKELRASIDSLKTDSRQKSIDRQLADITKKIEASKHAGKINHLTVMDEVETALIQAGYVVQHHSALGMGDMESITISW